MADMNPVSFLLNQGSDAKENQVVEAPAFSLTKVLSSGAVILTPIAAAVVSSLDSVDFSASNYVALAVGLLGFLAITAAADVLARAVATSAEKNAQAAAAAIGQMVMFNMPLPAHRRVFNPARDDVAIEVLASVQAGEPYFLTREGGSITWEPASGIRIP